MRLTEDCLEALAKGHHLVTKYGQEVWFDSKGVQQANGMGKNRKGRPYRFSSPEEWSIKPKPKKSNDWILIILGVVLVMAGGLIMALASELKKANEPSTQQQALRLQLDESEAKVKAQALLLEKYNVTTEQLINLGATKKQANTIVKAAEVHNISPKF